MGCVRVGVLLAVACALLAAGCAAGTGTGDRPVAASTPRLEACEPGSSPTARTGAPPDVTLPCLQPPPTSVRLAGLTARPTVVNLWASWCQPCRPEMPMLQAAHQRWSGRVRFLGVDVRDDPANARDFLATVGVTYPQVVDAAGRLPALLGSPGVPVTIVLSSDGVVVWRRLGTVGRGELTRVVEAQLPRA